MADPLFDPPPFEPSITAPLRPSFPPPIKPPVTPIPVPVAEPPPEPVPVPVPEPGIPHDSGSPEAVPDLGILALLIVVLGLIALAAALVDLFKWLFRFMLGPLASRGRTQTLTVEKLTQPLSNILGSAYSGVDAHLGISFTKLGAMTGRTGGAILATERRVYTAVTHLARLEHGQAALRGDNATTNARVQAVQHTAVRADTRAATEAARAQTQEQALVARLHALETHITTLLEPELDRLRAQIPHLENGQAVAFDRIQKHEDALGIGPLTAATAVALGRLGADWASCETSRSAGEALCGAGAQNVRNVLNLLLAGGILLDFKAYVRLEQTLVKPVTETIATLLRVSV
jgi:hypothetical protein